MSTLLFVKSYLLNPAHLAISAAAWAPMFQWFVCWQTAIFVFCCFGAVVAPISANLDAEAQLQRARE